MKIMLVGDICGRPGRRAIAYFLPILKKEYGLDVIIANGENSAGGLGITAPVAQELFASGIDVVTTGNHIWDKKEIFTFIDTEERLIRPANYPPGTPGRGYAVISNQGVKIGVINLAGRVYMPALDCPFTTVSAILAAISPECSIIIVDFHAEATSEKMALGWFLDGKISCLVGTHTHIQTADERILPQGTGYITDLGMVGPWNSVLGVEKEVVVKKFLTGLPVKFSLAGGKIVFWAIIMEVNNQTGKVIKIERVKKFLD